MSVPLTRRSLLAASTAGLLAGPTIAGTPQPPALAKLFGGPFTLTDHNGKKRTDKDFRGRFMLIYFGYTYCPDICPTNLQHMAGALDMLGARAAQVVPVFITIDPERDTPEALKEYVANFGDSFVGLTGTEPQIRAVARAYRIHRRKVLPVGEKDKTAYLVDHSSITYLVGPDGKFVTLFPHNTSAETIARRLAGYLSRQS